MLQKFALEMLITAKGHRKLVNDRTPQRVIVTLAILLLTLALAACQPIVLESVSSQPVAEAASASASAADMPPLSIRSRANVHLFPASGENDVPGATSTLERTPDGVTLTIDTVDLAPDEAYTIWWVIFNHPEACSDGQCMAPDLSNPETAAMVSYATGAIADEQGRAHFTASLSKGDASGALDNASGFPFELVEPAPGLLNPLTAEIHAVIRTHGAAMEDPAEQLSSFSGGCNPECANRQATMHLAEAWSPMATSKGGDMPVVSLANVHLFPATGENDVAGAKSALVRTAAGVTVNIDTVDLAPGEAYTIWWVIFNHPEACSDGQCVAPDLSNPETAAMVSYATGAIADEQGRAHFTASLSKGDASGALDNASGFPFELVEPAPGLLNPLTAEIHAVIRTHGAAMDDPAEQLSSFNGGCNPECTNVQATMYLAEAMVK